MVNTARLEKGLESCMANYAGLPSMSNKASSTKNGMMIGNEAALPTSKALEAVIEPVIGKATDVSSVS